MPIKAATAAAAKVSEAATAAATKVSKAATAAAFILASASKTLEMHVDANGERITALENRLAMIEKEVKSGNSDISQVLVIVSAGKVGGKFLAWLVGVCASGAIAWATWRGVK